MKHIRDSIERKLNEIQFDRMSTAEIVGDIFGTVTDCKKELVMQKTETIFSTNYWQRYGIIYTARIEGIPKSIHRIMSFYDWFCVNYSDVFIDNVVRSVRTIAGLGTPPHATVASL